jgi:outer membrane protein assembly factor BamB
MAFDNNTLFVGTNYMTYANLPHPLVSGLYAFDPDSGKQKWFQGTKYTSTISAAGGHVYGVEDGTVVARNQSDGSVAWSQDVSGVGRQAPVLAGELAIVAGLSAVVALDAKDGSKKWSAPVSGAAAPFATITYGSTIRWTSAHPDGVSPAVMQAGIAATTTMAAALDSQTLVVTAGTAIHVLSLSDGHEVWSGGVSKAIGSVREPVIIGKRVYVTDTPNDPSQAGLIALDAQ